MQLALWFDDARPRPAKGWAVISGPGWAVPDQALHPWPLPDWDRRIRIAVDALTDGLGDRVAMRLFIDADRPDEAAAALTHHEYRMRLRRATLRNAR